MDFLGKTVAVIKEPFRIVILRFGALGHEPAGRVLWVATIRDGWNRVWTSNKHRWALDAAYRCLVSSGAYWMSLEPQTGAWCPAVLIGCP